MQGEKGSELAGMSELRLLCSIEEGEARADWKDMTESIQLGQLDGDSLVFPTSISARYWLMHYSKQRIREPASLARVREQAGQLYRQLTRVPFMTRFAIFAKRRDINEANVRVFCMTDDREERSLEVQEHYSLVAKSRPVEVLEGQRMYLELGGNLLLPLPMHPSQRKRSPAPHARRASALINEQPWFTFRAFQENRLAFAVRVRELNQEPSGRIAFMEDSMRYLEELSSEQREFLHRNSRRALCTLGLELPPMCVSYDSILGTPKRNSYYASACVGELNLAEIAELLANPQAPPAGRSSSSRSRFIHSDESDPSDQENDSLSEPEEEEEDWRALAPRLGIPRDEVDFILDYCARTRTSESPALLLLMHWYKLAAPDSREQDMARALLAIKRPDILQQLRVTLEPKKMSRSTMELLREIERIPVQSHENLYPDGSAELFGETRQTDRSRASSLAGSAHRQQQLTGATSSEQIQHPTPKVSARHSASRQDSSGNGKKHRRRRGIEEEANGAIAIRDGEFPEGHHEVINKINNIIEDENEAEKGGVTVEENSMSPKVEQCKEPPSEVTHTNPVEIAELALAVSAEAASGAAATSSFSVASGQLSVLAPNFQTNEIANPTLDAHEHNVQRRGSSNELKGSAIRKCSSGSCSLTRKENCSVASEPALGFVEAQAQCVAHQSSELPKGANEEESSLRRESSASEQTQQQASCSPCKGSLTVSEGQQIEKSPATATYSSCSSSADPDLDFESSSSSKAQCSSRNCAAWRRTDEKQSASMGTPVDMESDYNQASCSATEITSAATISSELAIDSTSSAQEQPKERQGQQARLDRVKEEPKGLPIGDEGAASSSSDLNSHSFAQTQQTLSSKGCEDPDVKFKGKSSTVSESEKAGAPHTISRETANTSCGIYRGMSSEPGPMEEKTQKRKSGTLTTNDLESGSAQSGPTQVDIEFLALQAHEEQPKHTTKLCAASLDKEIGKLFSQDAKNYPTAPIRGMHVPIKQVDVKSSEKTRRRSSCREGASSDYTASDKSSSTAYTDLKQPTALSSGTIEGEQLGKNNTSPTPTNYCSTDKLLIPKVSNNSEKTQSRNKSNTYNNSSFLLPANVLSHTHIQCTSKISESSLASGGASNERTLEVQETKRKSSEPANIRPRSDNINFKRVHHSTETVNLNDSKYCQATDSEHLSTFVKKGCLHKSTPTLEAGDPEYLQKRSASSSIHLSTKADQVTSSGSTYVTAPLGPTTSSSSYVDFTTVSTSFSAPYETARSNISGKTSNQHSSSTLNDNDTTRSDMVSFSAEERVRILSQARSTPDVDSPTITPNTEELEDIEMSYDSSNGASNNGQKAHAPILKSPTPGTSQKLDLSEAVLLDDEIMDEEQLRRILTCKRLSEGCNRYPSSFITRKNSLHMIEELPPLTEGETMRHMSYHLSQNIELSTVSSGSSGSLRVCSRPQILSSKRGSQDENTSCSSSTSLERSPTRRRSSTVSQCSSVLSESTRNQLNFDLSPDLPPDSSLMEANAISPTEFERPNSPEPSSLGGNEPYEFRANSRISNDDLMLPSPDSTLGDSNDNELMEEQMMRLTQSCQQTNGIMAPLTSENNMEGQLNLEVDEELSNCEQAI